jgi:aspartate/glutamate racemase
LERGQYRVRPPGVVVEHLSFEARYYVWWQRLEAAGPELWPLGTNTMHSVADQVQAAVSIPLLHLADTTAVATGARGAPTLAE